MPDVELGDMGSSPVRKSFEVSGMIEWLKSWFKPRKKQREIFLWCHCSPGTNQIGREADIDGRKGKVVDGNDLTITIEWNN